LRQPGEADLGVIWFITDQQHQRMALRLCPGKAFLHQGEADPQPLAVRMDGERAEQQCGR